jgi:hypothetical protein
MEETMQWLRRIAAAPLLLLTLICAIGTIRIFTHDLPDESVGTGVFTALLAAATAAGAFLLLRPDLLLLRQVSFAQFRDWVYVNPLGQAAALYVIAAILMVAVPEYELAPAFLAVCALTVAAPWTAALQQRWWAYAGLAVLGWCLLFLALAGTAEVIRPRGFGEGGMVFLLPMEGFPMLLAASGIVRLIRRGRSKTSGPPTAE